ncbi:MAG: mycofactocin system GMC family oxidoreductase MftG [Dehalococcoidia bacterium]|nr:mycofactocin system GMC family oxidoreductase MftG [Dehalococcoidia bacterium]|tara:strand:- start:8043 stop:9617 length:1575 start_codon:yes stop_codon:yes gene_type:complete
MNPVTTFDTVVVGAGSSGAVMASRLSEDPHHSVLLIESGPDYGLIEDTPTEIIKALPRNVDIASKLLGKDSIHDWSYTATATDLLNTISVPRGRLVGGSSAVNSSIFLRGIPEDYDLWATHGNNEWSYEHLLAYMRLIEDDPDFSEYYHGKLGPTPVLRFKENTWAKEQEIFYTASVGAGYQDCPDHNAPNSSGVGPLPLNISQGVRWNSAMAYLMEARSRENLTIQADTHVRKILLQNGTANGLEIEHKNSISKVLSHEIILCSGTISTPQILMLSGIGQTSVLESADIKVMHDLPGVGKNLWDHPQVHLKFKTSNSIEHQYDSPRLQVGLKYTATNSPYRNDMFVLPTLFTSHTAPDPSTNVDSVFRLVFCLYFAQSLGQIRIRSADPHEHPEINFHYLSDPFDRIRLREAVNIGIDMADRKEFTELIDHRISPENHNLKSDFELDNWIMRNLETSHHAAGTAKMGPTSDRYSVVDQFGKLHGIDGIRIADASVMPSSVRANTHLTSLLVGERIADFIKKGL